MQIFNEPNFNPNLSIALGFFDGVHLGHKKVIKSAVDFAKQNNIKSAIITFSEHPYKYLKNISPKYLSTKKDREQMIDKLEIDYLYELDFKKISKLPATDYLENILVKYFAPSAISTGWNHNFGYNKTGNAKFLYANETKYKYKYFELPPEKFENEIISSTTIRNLLLNGEISKANSMLGYKFKISGKIVKGNQLGRTIGFPTSNLEYPTDLIELPHGVYSVKTNYGEGIANYGSRPTINGVEPILEVNILDFNKDIYGKFLTVEFNKMIRTEKRFPSLNALKKQIQLDIKSI